MASLALSSSALDKKRAVKEERLQSHYHAYLHDSSLRRSLAAAASNPDESLDAFLAAFCHHRDQVEDKLTSFRSRKSLTNDGDEAASLRAELEGLLLDISNLESLVAESSFFLPTYSLQSSQASIIKLKEEVEAATNDLVPKKKFSFRSKIVKLAKESLQHKDTLPSIPVSVVDRKPNLRQGTTSTENNIRQLSFQGIKDQQGCTLVRYPQDLSDREYTLSNLSNCKVYLEGKCTALYVHNLRNCLVCTGPVAGSALIDGVEGSTLMLASHQIRIHATKSSDFYLRVRSRPTVEYTTAVRFAPYAFKYSGINDDLRSTNLLEETGLWENVDDFRWLRAVQSPNWSIVPSSERISTEHTEEKNKS